MPETPLDRIAAIIALDVRLRPLSCTRVRADLPSAAPASPARPHT